MKYLVLFFVTMSTCFSLARISDPVSADALDGRVVGSYIIQPNRLSGYSVFYDQLNNLKKISPDLYAVLTEGLLNPKWYFIPSQLYVNSTNQLDIPTDSDQIAVQVFKTREIWFDQNKFNSLKSDNERAKAMAQEAFLAGLNSFLKKRNSRVSLGAGKTNEPNADVYFVFQADETISDIKAIIRPTVELIMSPDLKEMKSDEFLSKLEGLGWNLKKEKQVVCTQGAPLYRFDIISFIFAESKKVFSCTEISSYK